MSSAERLVAGALAAAGLPTQPCERIKLGESGDMVARLDGLYLKVAQAGPDDRIAELEHETRALAWLSGKVVAPQIVWAGEIEGGRALVTTALAGVPVCHVAPDAAPAALADTLRALALLHALPAAGCPFDARLDVKLAQAAERVALGLVDEDDFDAERAGWTAAQVLAKTRSLAPADERLVPCHGDACLPNFIWTPDGGVGLIDLGRFGLADPYQDLALFLRSTAFNFPGLDAEALVLAHYPASGIDPDRCAFYRLLDELF